MYHNWQVVKLARGPYKGWYRVDHAQTQHREPSQWTWRDGEVTDPAVDGPYDKYVVALEATVGMLQDELAED